MPHQLAVSTSPSGATVIFMGDPSLPMFCDPGSAPGPGMAIRPYTSIEHFLPSYVQGRFGQLPGFRVLGMAPSPELFQIVGEKARRSGATQLWVTAAKLFFEHRDEDRLIRAVVLGSCTSFGGVWLADVCGASTRDDPEPYVAVLLGMVASRAATPAMNQRQLDERTRSAAQHESVMRQLDQNAAILRANHENNMATLQGMAESHQAHMASLHEAHDAHNAGWQATQDSRDAAHAASLNQPDDGHRRFLNVIAEERTVTDAEGNTHQLADGYDRYFQRRLDGTWIGTRGDRDLSGLPGVNPDEYDEGKIKI